MSDIQIRALTVADRDWLSSLIKKLVTKIGASDVLSYMVSDSSNEAKKPEADEETGTDKKYALLVVELIKIMIDEIGEDVRQWFASLVGKTPEEFKELPFDTELTILEKLVEMQEANGFFSRALALSSKIKGFGNTLKGANKQ